MKEEGRINFLFPNQKRSFFFSPNQKMLFWKVKINSFWEGKKMNLGCLEKKANDYSLEVQHPLVEEERRLEV